mmetsp:Transcript_73637/g.178174  ORF Transcript_73637/g.178174 Transcript_73637/m.178174 type:complete len:142 (+) Transcript_73637:328-753(+)
MDSSASDPSGETTRLWLRVLRLWSLPLRLAWECSVGDRGTASPSPERDREPADFAADAAEALDAAGECTGEAADEWPPESGERTEATGEPANEAPFEPESECAGERAGERARTGDRAGELSLEASGEGERDLGGEPCFDPE